MILISDSGSTKADWLIYENGAPEQEILSTQGFNPFFHKPDYITATLQSDFKDVFDKSGVKAVYYYGAGCSDNYRCDMVAGALKKVFPNAKVEVEHDLTAAARATCGKDPGIACIIGTGSNSCSYDGNKIVDHVSNLGYLLGDEGSGTHLSKELIRCYFYREMPEDLANAFQDNFEIEERHFLNTLYSHDSPNTYLASFARFLSQHKTHGFIKKIVRHSLREFLDRHVCKYPEHRQVPVHFVGSIAYYFNDILKDLMDERYLTLGKTIKKPINHLLDYHIN